MIDRRRPAERRHLLGRTAQAMVEWGGLLTFISVLCMVSLFNTGTNVKRVLEGVNAAFTNQATSKAQSNAGGVGASSGRGSACSLATGRDADGGAADLAVLLLPLLVLRTRARRDRRPC